MAGVKKHYDANEQRRNDTASICRWEGVNAIIELIKIFSNKEKECDKTIQG